jgi:hypothetical protein
MPLGRLPLLLILFILSATSFGQVKPTDMGLELQVYPTGLLPGIRIDQALSPYSSIHLRGGFNLFDHQNFGVQDNEEGWGMGLTLGFRRYLSVNWEKWFLSARTVFWLNRVNWKSLGVNDQILASGTTKLLVVQPTLEGGYQFTFANDTWFLTPTLALGMEINAVTQGAPTGQGAILLLGFQTGRRFL